LIRKEQYEMFEELPPKRFDDRRRERLRKVDARNDSAEGTCEVFIPNSAPSEA
jgi:hypothetical protein